MNDSQWCLPLLLTLFLRVFEIRWLNLCEAMEDIVYSYHPQMLLLEEDQVFGERCLRCIKPQEWDVSLLGLIHPQNETLGISMKTS